MARKHQKTKFVHRISRGEPIEVNADVMDLPVMEVVDIDSSHEYAVKKLIADRRHNERTQYRMQ